MLTLLGLMAGLLQVSFGVLRLGRLIEYMPYPVVSGYLTGVGLIIIGSQVPKLLGAPKGLNVWHALAAPEIWSGKSLLIGAVTALVMVGAPRFVKLVPAAILGLLAGVLAYFGLALAGAAPLTPEANSLVVGPLGGGGGASFTDALTGRWQAMSALDLTTFKMLFFPALTLAGLLSIDTLKTCLVLDALTRSRHNSNRELIGQGLGNISSAIIGGMPGAGTMGATLVNLSSGAASRLSGVMEGGLALVAFLVLGSLIAWVPVAALAAILIVIGVRMIDRNSLHFLKSRSTLLDFVVIAAVVLHGADGQPDRGVGRRHPAGDPAVHPRTDRRRGSAAQAARQPALFQAGAHPRGNGNPHRARRQRRHLRIAGQPVLRHHQPALHGAGGRPEDAPLSHPRHAPRADGGRHRRPHARADQGHAGRTRRLPDLQPDPAEAAFRSRHPQVPR